MSWLSSSLSSLFGMNKKQKQPPVITGPYDQPEGKTFAEVMRQRAAGQGIGMDEKFLSTATSPIAEAERANLQAYTLPAINTAASAKGLGRSTLPVSMGRQASQEVEQGIGTRMANLRISNEDIKRSQQDQALNALNQIATGKAETLNAQNKANYDQAQISMAAGAEGLTKMLGIGGPIVGGGIGAIAGGIVGGPAGALVGAQLGASIGGQMFQGTGQNNSYSQSDFDILDQMMKRKSGTQVNVGSFLPYNTLDMIKGGGNPPANLGLMGGR